MPRRHRPLAVDTVFKRDGVKYFGPVAFGEFPEEYPPVDSHFLRVNHFADAESEWREPLWYSDLIMMAGFFQKKCLIAVLQDIDLHGLSLAPLIGRIGDADEHIIKALGLWGCRVEMTEDVRGFGVMLPAGTRGVICHGAYRYVMAGMCAYAGFAQTVGKQFTHSFRHGSH